MSMKMSVSNDEIDLRIIINDSKIVSDNILKACGKVLKARVVGSLNAIRTNRTTHKHMADDVQVKIERDKFGYEVLKVSGGHSTGTKWHLVNDGTFKNKATHFMDNAISQSQSEIEGIIDAEMRKQGF